MQAASVQITEINVQYYSVRTHLPEIWFLGGCMRQYDEYRQLSPNPEGGAHSNATLFNNHQQNNSEWRELHTWKQSPLDRDHVLTI